jgi:pimeloyl-ACP methyl ester carboxylesterase/predicted ester cyclase
MNAAAKSQPQAAHPGAGAAAGAPLLLLPGTLCDSRVFTPLLDRLGDENVQIIPLSGAASAPALARAILARAPPRFVLAGFSLGGIVALEIAAQAPERVVGMALIATNPRADRPGGAESRHAQVAEARANGPGGLVVEQLWPLYVSKARQGDKALKSLILDMAEAVGARTFADQTEVAITRADSLPRLADMTMPVLALCGEDDVICPVEFHQAIVEAAPNAALRTVAGAGHFLLLEAPDAAAAHLGAWLATLSSPFLQPPLGDNTDQGPAMSDDAAPAKSVKGRAASYPSEDKAVLQVERRDFVDLVPENRERVQSMRGFDDCYTDIVDYIVRCTHKIWDERDVGLIYTHYTHNCVAYSSLGTVYNREDVVRETIQRIVELPDRRGMATQVVWRGNDVDGFYTSHLVTGTGRHTEYGMYGKPTGRTFAARTIADCMILENKIYREWLVRDNMALIVQLGLDPHAFAADMAAKQFEKGQTIVEIGENRRMIGQYPPESKADLSIAHTDGEAQLLEWLHHIYNKRMFGKIHDIYAPNVQWHGPMMRELFGVAAVLQQTMRLVAMIPDGAFIPQHICSNPCEEGGEKIAVRWIMDGHHLGYGTLGAPTGHKLFVMGMSHFHVIDGKIVDEWVVYDDLAMLVQLKLGALAALA